MRPKVTMKRLDKLETKLMRRIDRLQRNLFDVRTLRARIVSEMAPISVSGLELANASQDASK